MSAISIVVVCEYIVDICCCLFNELGFLSEAVLFAAVLVVLSNVCSIEFSSSCHLVLLLCQNKIHLTKFLIGQFSNSFF